MYSDNAGYVMKRKCQAACGGHVVIYDRKNGFEIDADERWIVMHEPSSLHVSVRTKRLAYAFMKDAAEGHDTAGILPEDKGAL